MSYYMMHFIFNIMIRYTRYILYTKQYVPIYIKKITPLEICHYGLIPLPKNISKLYINKFKLQSTSGLSSIHIPTYILN